ncbi:unnamed protein product [Prorocentrum cordatum]|uniref:Poly(ADP-ribose) glycohydrolase n=1 Tax=Prorocentrum cordatum TaxID=2364126 RepID=A0ABN9XFK9_9DINO|nr:unnamed protein product [Polarella glacialis]
MGEGETGCTSQVAKAMLNDIFETPADFPGLTSDSCLEEFQAFLATNGSRGACPQPCSATCRPPTPSVEASVLHTAECPACTPEVPQAPDVVIPFFERDLCKLKYTVKSIVLHDPEHHLGNIILMWVSKHPPSKYQADLDEVKALVTGRQVTLLDYSPQVQEIDGWFVQQVLKLKVAANVGTDFYLVLDAKNTFLQDVDADTFFTPCNQARVPAQYASIDDVPLPHKEWFQTAQRLLQTTPPETALWPTSVTPIVLHRQTVLEMLDFIGEKVNADPLCQGPICFMFGCGFNTDGKVFATEFTMYLMYAYSKIQTSCVHSVEQRDELNRWAASLWRGVPETVDEVREKNLESLRNIAGGTNRPLSFGGQPDSLKNTSMSKGQKEEAEGLLIQIYLDAQVIDSAAVGSKDLDKFISCMV